MPGMMKTLNWPQYRVKNVLVGVSCFIDTMMLLMIDSLSDHVIVRIS